MRKLTRLEQLDYLISYLKEQIKILTKDLREAEEERNMILKKEKK